ncbi:MAG: DUF2516 family protein [Bifidobacteriaceae bacterium]|jgi:hypothetical protein|nr:DUF2516 family protein [Bifidobacteriaceae bacterium]
MIGFTQWLIFSLLSGAAFAVEIWAFASAAKAPAGAYAVAGRLSKAAWLAITGVSALIGLAALPTPFRVIRFGGLLTLAALVAALVFLTGVRPKVRRAGGGPSRPTPPTGGW